MASCSYIANRVHSDVQVGLAELYCAYLCCDVKVELAVLHSTALCCTALSYVALCNIHYC